MNTYQLVALEQEESVGTLHAFVKIRQNTQRPFTVRGFPNDI
jgi:hypothetical protein